MLKEKLNKAIEEKGDAVLTPNPSQPMSVGGGVIDLMRSWSR